jgi:tetratricopeptide (TPR) repeat protein
MSPENATPTENNPSTADDFVAKGWSEHVNGEHAESEASFRKALELNAQSIEAYYGLAMALKSQNQLQPAIEAFEKVVVGISTDQLKDESARLSMLRSLAKTQIEFIRKRTEPNS